VYDDAFLTRGVHSLKFGVAVERMEFNQLQPANPSGQFTFSHAPRISSPNQPRRFQKSFVTSSRHGIFARTLFGSTSKTIGARFKLTLNLGLRYEITTSPHEVHGRLATLVNLTDAIPHLGTRTFEPHSSQP